MSFWSKNKGRSEHVENKPAASEPPREAEHVAEPMERIEPPQPQPAQALQDRAAPARDDDRPLDRAAAHDPALSLQLVFVPWLTTLQNFQASHRQVLATIFKRFPRRK